MPEQLVRAFIDEGNVKFVSTPSAGRPDPRPPNTFIVVEGDSVRWLFFNAQGNPLQPADGRVRVRFHSSPAGAGSAEPLLDPGTGASDILNANGNVITASVNRNARGGAYSYKVERVSPTGTIVLDCICATSPSDRGVPVPMAGGHKSPPPPGA